MIKKMIPVMLLLSSLATLLMGQNNCPTCAVVLPQNLPADTLYLAPAPVGRAGEWYNADIAFRVPRTTTPVAAIDSTVIPGVTINRITLNGISNLPAGLGWQVPQAVFNLPDSTDGCIKICGMPLQPGLYVVTVVITAQVFILSQTASFTFPILIEPAQSITDGFTMNNASGCGIVTVSFENNVPSGGNPGFSYLWDFGNGNFSPEENPVQQTYSMPGQYRVNYQAVVDTVGHILTRVRIDGVTCSDLFNGPDLKIFVYDPDSVVVFSSNVVQNASTPLEFLMNLPIETGNYRLRVIDVDDGILGGADDECGSITFNRGLSGNLIGGPLRVFLEIIHPVDTIRSVDTVTVFPQPAAPVISGIPNGPVCAGDPLSISTNYTNNLQWYRDSIPLIPGNEPVIDISENGHYQVVYTSSDGCRAHSAPAVIEFALPPTVPVFTSANNRLTLFDPATLPLAARLQWYFNGAPIPDATGTTYCIPESGEYTLEVRDLITGCTSSFTLPITYNPNAPSCFSSTKDGSWSIGGINVYPNPTSDVVEVYLQLESLSEIRWQLIDANGKITASGDWGPLLGETRQRIDLSSCPAGFYVLRLLAGAEYTIVKIVKR